MLAVQIVVSVLLVVVVLLQQQGSGLGAAWGGSGASYGTRQGIEKLLFRSTIGLIVLFVVVSVLVML